MKVVGYQYEKQEQTKNIEEQNTSNTGQNTGRPIIRVQHEECDMMSQDEIILDNQGSDRHQHSESGRVTLVF